jgi:glutamyl-tRNA(Gln) amidotransferase subunit E
VNVSVTGGTRIEIKGVPRIPDIPLLTYNEAMRQHNLLCLRDELHRRGITRETFASHHEVVTKILRKTRFQPIRNAIAEGAIVQCVHLRGFQGLLRWRTQTDTYFSREISDRVRVVACLTTLPNIIHSDSPSETLSSSEWQSLKKTMGASDGDTLIAVWGDSLDAATGASEVEIRAREATIGIPSETRQALRDGTNGFERILPGPDRMYPDTDLPPLRITAARLERIKAGIPRPFWEREDRYRQLGVPPDLLVALSSSPLAGLFDTATAAWHISPALAAVTLIQLPKRVQKVHGSGPSISQDTLRAILLALRDGVLAKEGIFPQLLATARGTPFSRAALPPPCSEHELQTIIDECRRSLAATRMHNPDRSLDYLMGLVMRRVRGRLDGRIVARHLGLITTETRP